MKKTSRHTIEECYYLGMSAPEAVAHSGMSEGTVGKYYCEFNIKKIIDNSERNRLPQIHQIEARLFEAIAKKESHLTINDLSLTYSKFLLI